jgi:glycosyltransferase involved in cell wall biosynthesis
MLRANVQFDSRAALRLPAADHLISFNGASLRQFTAARAARYESVGLMSATSHMRRVTRQYALAHRQYPLERSWAGHLLRRNLREYERADRIYVSSQHAWGSFIEEGFPEHRLSLFPLTPDPRFEVQRGSPAADTFDIVYVGSLSVAKGVPLLVDAVRRVAGADIRLLLVGGWGTRGMRRFIAEACAQDPRITVCQGDPLARLRGARLYVHPSYEDGFGYAPAEALACGVPVIVSESTGMKELIDPHNGVVVPTGALDPLCEAIEAAHRGEILGG